MNGNTRNKQNVWKKFKKLQLTLLEPGMGGTPPIMKYLRSYCFGLHIMHREWMTFAKISPSFSLAEFSLNFKLLLPPTQKSSKSAGSEHSWHSNIAGLAGVAGLSGLICLTRRAGLAGLAGLADLAGLAGLAGLARQAGPQLGTSQPQLVFFIILRFSLNLQKCSAFGPNEVSFHCISFIFWLYTANTWAEPWA